MKKDRCKAIRRDRGWGKWKCQAGDHYSAQSIITMGERGPDFRIFQDKTEIGLLCENSQSGYVNFFKKDMYYLFIWPSQVSVAALSAGSHYGRSRPWRGHEENTGQARPSGTPSIKTGQARPSRIRDPPGWPRPLPHPVSSPLFCCCSCLPCCGFLCCLPRALLLFFHWIKTNLKP